MFDLVSVCLCLHINVCVNMYAFFVHLYEWRVSIDVYVHTAVFVYISMYVYTCMLSLSKCKNGVFQLMCTYILPSFVDSA